jgi:superfamily II DNA or RNA helicase
MFLAERLSPFVNNLIVLKGGMGQKQRRQIADKIDGIPRNEERLIIATGRYLGEGFDDARLDTLFLALPVSWRGVLAQYAGRLHRLYDLKKEVIIYDYADLEVPMKSQCWLECMRGDVLVTSVLAMKLMNKLCAFCVRLSGLMI